MHESGHPKFRFHPYNNINGGFYNTSGVPGHIENTIMSYSNSTYHDPYMIATLRALHGPVAGACIECLLGEKIPFPSVYQRGPNILVGKVLDSDLNKLLNEKE